MALSSQLSDKTKSRKGSTMLILLIDIIHCYFIDNVFICFCSSSVSSVHTLQTEN